MTVEYDAPHRTHPQILADDMTTALHNLRRDWPQMIPQGGAQVAPGWATKSGAGHSGRSPGVVCDDGRIRYPQDQSPDVPGGRPADDEPKPASDDDTRRIDKIISLRVHVGQVLNGWCRVIIEDRHITTTPVDGCDPLAMSRFLTTHAEWMSGHEAAQDCRDEIVTLAQRCHLIADPPKRESMSIGRCPLRLEDDTECGGDVRARPNMDEVEAYASCGKCGETAVASWWEAHMFDDPETRALLTDADVVTLIHRLYGQVIKQATVRQWVRRAIITPSGQADANGRRLFAREAVIYAIDLHKRRERIG